MKSIRLIRLLAFCWLFATAASHSHADAWTLQSTDAAWRLDGFDHPKDLSAVASAGAGHAVVVTDEGRHLQPAAMDAERMTFRALAPVDLPLPGGASGKKAEADLEGVVWSPQGSCYYAVGSHGLGKKKGDYQQSRHGVYRIPYDARKGGIRMTEIECVSLAPVIRSHEILRAHDGKALQKNGLNIEGLAEKDGTLWFGLRAPNVDGRGFVIQVAAADLFAGRHADAKVHAVSLGDGRGIREITAVSDGFLILAGNASAEASKQFPETMAPGPDTKFTIHHWVPGKSDSVPVGDVPSGDGKAEGMMVLAEDGRTIRLLVIFDGISGGAPLVLELHRPASGGS